MLPIVIFSVVIAVRNGLGFGGFWRIPLYALFDSLIWIGTAFLVFAVIERRQTKAPQSRLVAIAAGTLGISVLAASLVTVRTLFESTMRQWPFERTLLENLPADFFIATFCIAIITGIGYAVYSWAVEDHQLAEAAELDAAIARAELKTAEGRLQPELVNAALVRISAVMETDVSEAQHLIAALGEQLHVSLMQSLHSSPPASGTTERDSHRARARARGRRSG
jgi:hypothetical protein